MKIKIRWLLSSKRLQFFRGESKWSERHQQGLWRMLSKEPTQVLCQGSAPGRLRFKTNSKRDLGDIRTSKASADQGRRPVPAICNSPEMRGGARVGVKRSGVGFGYHSEFGMPGDESAVTQPGTCPSYIRTLCEATFSFERWTFRRLGHSLGNYCLSVYVHVSCPKNTALYCPWARSLNNNVIFLQTEPSAGVHLSARH